MRTVLFLSYFPPSVNTWNGRNGRFLYRKVKHACDVAVTSARLSQYPDGEPHIQAPFRILIARRLGHRQRAFDIDNAIASVKPLIDALKRDVRGHVVIEDDKHRMLNEVRVTQRKFENIDPNINCVVVVTNDQ